MCPHPITKTYPHNPNIQKIISPEGKVTYFLAPPIPSSSLIPVFNYDFVERASKPAEGIFLGKGGYGIVLKRRNPSAEIAVKHLTSPQGEKLIQCLNECYHFVHHKNLLKYFPIPIHTSNTTQLMRYINGPSLTEYKRKNMNILTKAQARKMFAELEAALLIFGERYAHNDIWIDNIIYDIQNKCFALIDFDRVCTNENLVQLSQANRDMSSLKDAEEEFIEIIDHIQRGGTFREEGSGSGVFIIDRYPTSGPIED